MKSGRKAEGMPSVEIKDIKNNVIGNMDVSEKFTIARRDALVHEAVVNYLANQRQGTHATKTKGLVSGSGRKPWKQKHTGRARVGTIRSPLWKGGGTIFGPQPRDYSYEMPKAARRLALYSAISAKLRDGEFTVVDGLKLDKPKTKDMMGILKNMGVQGAKTLIVLAEPDEALLLSARNIPNVSVVQAKDLNIYDVVVHGRILATKDAVEALEARPL